MQVAGCSPCQVQLPGFSMRFEHNLPVLVQPRWLPVGGPYAAFNLPVPFSPMSIRTGGWVAQMAQELRLAGALAAASQSVSPHHQRVLTGDCGMGWVGDKQREPSGWQRPCVWSWLLRASGWAVPRAITGRSPQLRSLPRKSAGAVPARSTDFSFPSFFL